MISKFTNKLKVKVGAEVQVDEVEFQRRKTYNRKGKEINWLIDSIYPETRFMVASGYGRTRSRKEIKAVMQNIKDKTGEQVKILTTDGWQAYKYMKKIWGYNLKERRYNVIHNRVNASKGEGFNHPIERLHNSIRARTKVMREFHGSINSANAILKGYEIYYNFITKQQAIKKRLYELVMPELELGKNKRLDLIKMSKA